MIYPFSKNVWDILVCPSCGHDLEKIDGGVECARCDCRYQYTGSDSLDLRLKRTKKYHLDFEIGAPLSDDGFLFSPLPRNPEPEVDFSNLSVPFHLSRETLSYFPKAKSTNGLMLDLGCGNAAVHKEVCQYAGFEWVGLDYTSAKAPILGDAHSLPFKDNSFEFILSIAVLEHIQNPFVMMREAYRVLKPHGKFIGTVAFLEPFHENSFYHHTHLGTFNSLRYGGFTIEHIAPSAKWSVLVAQAKMGLFPKMNSSVSGCLLLPLQLIHRLWWQAASLVSDRANEYIRIRNTTGAFTFVATKDQ